MLAKVFLFLQIFLFLALTLVIFLGRLGAAYKVSSVILLYLIISLVSYAKK